MDEDVRMTEEEIAAAMAAEAKRANAKKASKNRKGKGKSRRKSRSESAEATDNGEIEAVNRPHEEAADGIEAQAAPATHGDAVAVDEHCVAKGVAEDEIMHDAAAVPEEVSGSTEEEEWHLTGHSYIGRCVSRLFGKQSDGPTVGRITRWLPANEVTGDGALFHVVHDDGDEEDLDDGEVVTAMCAFDAMSPAEVATARAKMEARPYVARARRYENKLVKRSQRASSSSSSVAALRNEIIDLESTINPILQKAEGNTWASGRSGWLRKLSNASTAEAVANLLLQFEESIRSLQKVPDATERKPWLSQGDPALGRPARRFFPEIDAETGEKKYSAYDGVIVGWLPASGDDEALWHLQHQDDSDEEDLDETELAFALAAHATDQLEPTAAEKEYLAKLEKEEAATDTGAADSDTPGKGRVTRQKSDGNSKEEDDKGDESDSGSESSMEVTSGFGRVLDEAYGAQRLWLSAEGRERWREALSPPRSIALVALAIAGLRAHCRRFRGLQTRRLKKEDQEEAAGVVSAWYHPAAFLKPHARGPGMPSLLPDCGKCYACRNNLHATGQGMPKLKCIGK